MSTNHPRSFPGIVVIALVGIAGSALAAGFEPNDPYYFTNTPEGFPGQWHLNRQASGALVDANLAGAWSLAFTGQGVTIGIVEQGVDYTHPDLAPNFDLNRSWDFWGDDADPMPGSNEAEGHATQVAGVAAARGGNGMGVTGAAPFARVVSLRSETQATTYEALNRVYRQTAAATRYEPAGGLPAIDIKNHSYGFSTLYHGVSGRYGVPALAESVDALAASAEAGTINVFAAMNNRDRHGQQGRIDADANKRLLLARPEAIVVAGVGSNGKYAVYSNWGANVTVSAPTLGTGDGTTLGITTTDLGNGQGWNTATQDAFPDDLYTSRFSGTSSATPLVSGVLALAKEANPRLDTRMAKHLLARTSQLVDPDDNSPMGGWTVNGAGIHFNNNYGFGLIDAGAVVRIAMQYSGVTALVTTSTGQMGAYTVVPNNDTRGVTERFVTLETGPLEEVMVHLRVTGDSFYTAFFTGDIEALLTSPSGTTSLLMYRNGRDGHFPESDPLDWTFTANAFWGENPYGEWALTVRDVEAVAGNSYYEDFEYNYWETFEVSFRMGELIAIPEPETQALLFAALCGAVVVVRRRTVSGRG